jgi:hypothetical protein
MEVSQIRRNQGHAVTVVAVGFDFLQGSAQIPNPPSMERIALVKQKNSNKNGATLM